MIPVDEHIDFLLSKGYEETNTHSVFPPGTLARTVQRQYELALQAEHSLLLSDQKFSVVTIAKSEYVLDIISLRFDYMFDPVKVLSLQGMVAQSLHGVTAYPLSFSTDLPTYGQIVQDLTRAIRINESVPRRETLAKYNAHLHLNQLIHALHMQGYLDHPTALNKKEQQALQVLEQAIVEVYTGKKNIENTSVVIDINKRYPIHNDKVKFRIGIEYHEGITDFRFGSVLAQLGKEKVYDDGFFYPTLPKANDFYVTLKNKQAQAKALKVYQLSENKKRRSNKIIRP